MNDEVDLTKYDRSDAAFPALVAACEAAKNRLESLGHGKDDPNAVAWFLCNQALALARGETGGKPQVHIIASGRNGFDPTKPPPSCKDVDVEGMRQELNRAVASTWWPAAPSPWILADKLMPQSSTYVLCHGPRLRIIAVVGCWNSDPGCWAINGEIALRDEITHWQPLPEPPKD